MLIVKGGIAIDFDRLTIETPRLSLQPISHAFAQEIYREFTPEIARYMVPTAPQHIDETNAFIAEAIAQRGRSTDLIFAIVNRQSSNFLGVCGLHSRGNSRVPEFGIWLARLAHGHAYGREAIKGLRDWAVDTLEITAFVYPVDKANLPSRKIPESLNGTIVAEVVAKTMGGGTLDEVVYRIPAVKS